MPRILLVDNSIIALKRLVPTLEEEFEVDYTGDLSQAVVLIAQGTYDAFLLEYSVKGSLGFKLARIIRSIDIYHSTPMLLLSSSLTKRIEYAAMLLGFNRCLEKQLPVTELRQIVSKELSSPSKLRVELDYLETKCLSWREDNSYFQFSPEIGEVVKGVSFEDVSIMMAKRLKDRFSGSQRPKVFFDDIDLAVHSVKL